ncbi:hypothetical protein RAB80_017773 [Fusarium oxysporum f. sp. vasinfectum]|nr:hypothetical protein RAB80_017773 [Fusarium oxysporum f. sp. vasinfectum]KAK2926660.1 hypothetical protein FoTM2_013529 [Fusarium oxysporum f. sp. vasinfectum]
MSAVPAINDNALHCVAPWAIMSLCQVAIAIMQPSVSASNWPRRCAATITVDGPFLDAKTSIRLTASTQVSSLNENEVLNMVCTRGFRQRR